MSIFDEKSTIVTEKSIYNPYEEKHNASVINITTSKSSIGVSKNQPTFFMSYVEDKKKKKRKIR